MGIERVLQGIAGWGRKRSLQTLLLPIIYLLLRFIVFYIGYSPLGSCLWYRSYYFVDIVVIIL